MFVKSRLGILLFGHFEIARLSSTDDVAIFFVFFLLSTVILNWRSSMREFVSWRLCLIVFKTFSDRSGIRTHSHTRVPEFSTEEFIESGALDPRPSCRVYADFFLYDVCFFKWVEFAFQRFNLLSGFCHPFRKICVSTHSCTFVFHMSRLVIFCFVHL